MLVSLISIGIAEVEARATAAWYVRTKKCQILRHFFTDLFSLCYDYCLRFLLCDGTRLDLDQVLQLAKEKIVRIAILYSRKLWRGF